MRWYEQEEKYLQVLHDICVQLSKEYMKLYIITHRFQTKLRLPSIILSSLSGVASFGSSGFGNRAQKYISIGVGIVNVGIAIVQTYESYLKVGDIVSKSLSSSNAFKKLSDDIYCEIFIPVENRNSNGITFLRDCFSRYQTILEQAPPLEFHGNTFSDSLIKAQTIMETINANIRMSEIRTNDGIIVPPVDKSPRPSKKKEELPMLPQPEEPTLPKIDENEEVSFKDMKSVVLNR